MASRNRTLQFAVTGSLLALAPVAPVDTCSTITDPLHELSEPPADHPDHGPGAQTDRLRAPDGPPVVNPGPMPSGD
jgi:hypothetical protein